MQLLITSQLAKLYYSSFYIICLDCYTETQHSQDRCKLREVFQKRKWKLKMEFSFKRCPPLRLMDIISIHFLPHFFLLQLNLTYMKRILHLVSVKKITFKSSYDWLKIDIPMLVRPLTAILCLFRVTSATIYAFCLKIIQNHIILAVRE